MRRLNWSPYGMSEEEKGPYIRYCDHLEEIKEFTERISLDYNTQLRTGGALNETSGKKAEE